MFHFNFYCSAEQISTMTGARQYPQPPQDRHRHMFNRTSSAANLYHNQVFNNASAAATILKSCRSLFNFHILELTAWHLTTHNKLAIVFKKSDNMYQCLNHLEI